MPPLPEIQKAFLDEFSQLDERYRSLVSRGRKYPVRLSPRLKRLQAQVVRELKEKELGENYEKI